jgi:hypothetical protein
MEDVGHSSNCLACSGLVCCRHNIRTWPEAAFKVGLKRVVGVFEYGFVEAHFHLPTQHYARSYG